MFVLVAMQLTVRRNESPDLRLAKPCVGVGLVTSDKAGHMFASQLEMSKCI